MPGPKSLHVGRGYIQVGKRAVRILLECFLVNFVGNHEYTTDRFLKWTVTSCILYLTNQCKRYRYSIFVVTKFCKGFKFCLKELISLFKKPQIVRCLCTSPTYWFVVTTCWTVLFGSLPIYPFVTHWDSQLVIDHQSILFLLHYINTNDIILTNHCEYTEENEEERFDFTLTANTAHCIGYDKVCIVVNTTGSC